VELLRAVLNKHFNHYLSPKATDSIAMGETRSRANPIQIFAEGEAHNEHTMPLSLASLLVNTIFSTKKRGTEALGFENEFRGFLRKYEIEFDERYVRD